MAWYDSGIVAAIALGGFVCLIYFIGKRNGSEHQQHQAAHRAASHNNPPRPAGGAGGAAAAAPPQNQPHVPPAASAPVARLGPRFTAPKKTDDLSMLIAQQSNRNWTVILHTKTETLASGAGLPDLLAVSKLYPNLTIVHQAHSEKSIDGDIAKIKAAVDAAGSFGRQRLIVCQTDKGPEAIARQMEPVMLVSPNKALCSFMSAFVAFAVHVDPAATVGVNGISAEAVVASSSSSSSRMQAAAPSNKIHVVNSAKVVLPTE